MNQSIVNPLLTQYRAVQLEASKAASMVTCHYMTIIGGKPQPHGSGVFISIGKDKFLLTAAHVVDNMEDDVYVGIGLHTMIKLGGELTKNISFGNREDDKIDISILKLNDETIEKIKGTYIFTGQEELGINHVIKYMPMYQSVGFPASMSKYNSFKKSLKSRPFLYVTIPSDPKIYEELGCNTESNIVVHYNKNKVKDYSTGKFVNGPDLFGISGSGLWFTPAQVKLKGVPIQKKLIAIMSDLPSQNKQYMFGTRIDVFTEIIRKKYNLDIEESKFVNINL